MAAIATLKAAVASTLAFVEEFLGEEPIRNEDVVEDFLPLFYLLDLISE